MPSARQASARPLEPEVTYAPSDDTRRRWLDVTSQIDDGPAEAPFGSFAPPARARNTAPTAHLHAVPAPPPTARLTYRPAGLEGTPFAQQRAAAAPARATLPAISAGKVRLVALTAAALAGMVALYVVLSALFGFVQTKLDDMQYGRPRTTHLNAYVGHAGEEAAQPSHFLALNLDRRIMLIELPGGDTKNATTITGPYLFGDGEDLTPVKLSAEDVNGDGAADLLVTVKNEQLVYINERAKNSFHLMTPEERKALPAVAGPATIPTGGGPAPAKGGK